MIYFILIFIASYIISIIGWSVIIIICECADTYDELREKLCNSPAFIPVINIISVIGFGVIAIIVSVIQLIYEYFEIKELWDKIKDKKLPFRK